MNRLIEQLLLVTEMRIWVEHYPPEGLSEADKNRLLETARTQAIAEVLEALTPPTEEKTGK